MVLTVLMVILPYIIYALANQERWVSPFKLVRTTSIGCHLLSSYERGALDVAF